MRILAAFGTKLAKFRSWLESSSFTFLEASPAFTFGLSPNWHESSYFAQRADKLATTP